ncbi:WD40 repeat-like protein [Penicillium taxi]|uniref:WD40 repeat-like protein n=1 Tax=Penicillium taxi TaxID=168475 RepID=UPI002545AC80|nr:WD40 repeat-like protein [Penicillium taxi]KAJ5884893.1 WD40 repeat-like protein [Penicillium taxi]
MGHQHVDARLNGGATTRQTRSQSKLPTPKPSTTPPSMRPMPAKKTVVYHELDFSQARQSDATVRNDNPPREDTHQTNKSEPVDSRKLAKALGDFEQSQAVTSSLRKRQRVYADRFIPNRGDGQDMTATFNMLPEDASPSTPTRSKKRPTHGELNFQKTERANRDFSQLLRMEMFDTQIPQPEMNSTSPDTVLHIDEGRSHTPPAHLQTSNLTPSTPSKNLFNYSTPPTLTPFRTPRSQHTVNFNARSDVYSISPIRYDSQRLLEMGQKKPRSIPRTPSKVLDAPELQDDFYLNLVDWSSTNVLGVGLANSVYMWNADQGRVTKLCELKDDTVTSVNWIQRGTHLAIGTHKGLVQIWDVESCRRLRTMLGHTNRVGALAWNDHILTSGSRDRIIFHRDVRSPDQYVRRLSGHKQEICGLKWNSKDGQLASGGNDNMLMVWDKLNETPVHRFSEHTAAVKAIAWSPHASHLLASGGGTADRTIKFWNTSTGAFIKEVDTGSQVCNLSWSTVQDELVSTHGYSQNQIMIWKYPKLEQIACLTGHTFRVLYLAMSPDGQTVVTGAGDETLRFWKIFERPPPAQGHDDSKLVEFLR